MNVQGVIFDVGGTLIYSNDDRFEPANAWSAANFLRSRGFEFDTAKFAKQLVDLRRTLHVAVRLIILRVLLQVIQSVALHLPRTRATHLGN